MSHGWKPFPTVRKQFPRLETIQAAAAREAVDLKFGSGRNAQRCEESAAWFFMAYHEALAELNDFQEE